VVTARDGSASRWRYLYTDFAQVKVSHDPFIDSSFKTTINGETTGDNFGWSVNCSGDVNGDGYDDVVVGAPGYGISLGRAYVVYGNDSLVSNISASDANITFTSGSTGDKFGYSVGSLDLSGDGYSEILVGAPYNDTWNGSKTDAGAVYVFNGSSSMPKIINAANYTRAGENAYDHLGWSVANAFDMNNDNYYDIIVGAPHFDNGTILDAGKAYVFIVIPEYPPSVIPIISIVLLLTVWKLKLSYCRPRRGKKDNNIIDEIFL